MSEFEEGLEALVAKNVDLVPRAEIVAALRRAADVLEDEEDADPDEYKGGPK